MATARHMRSCVVLFGALTFAMLAAAPAHAEAATEVEVTRTRPQKEKHPTLQFLKENRNFIRARLDELRQRPKQGSGDGGALDPRFIAYQQMLDGILAAKDEAAAAEDARHRRTLLDHIEQLGRLEGDLDTMERLLGDQRERLAALQEDFTGRQETALMILLSGYPDAAALSAITIKDESGETHTVLLSDAQREALRQGGLVELLHRFVEPREQVIEVALAGDAWPGGNSGFLMLAPERDRLTFLKLDVSAVETSGGAATIRASTWRHDASLQNGDG